MSLPWSRTNHSHLLAALTSALPDYHPKNHRHPPKRVSRADWTHAVLQVVILVQLQTRGGQIAVTWAWHRQVDCEQEIGIACTCLVTAHHLNSHLHAQLPAYSSTYKSHLCSIWKLCTYSRSFAAQSAVDLASGDLGVRCPAAAESFGGGAGFDLEDAEPASADGCLAMADVCQTTGQTSKSTAHTHTFSQ
jgi:hypothetical protein